jgi:lysophospholipase L1-like esterase
MLAGWLLGHVVLVGRGRAGWVPLVVCTAILLVKRPYWPPALLSLVILMMAVAAGRILLSRTRSRSSAGYLRWASVAALSSVWVWCAVDWHVAARTSRHPNLDKTRPVVCLGDSLTSGVSPYGGYPDDLGGMLTVPVVNLGEAGITAQQALSLLPRIVRLRPQAVVVELGGHDFLRGQPRASTGAALEQIIATVQNAGAEVILMEIPRGFIVDPYTGLERELAREYDLELISDSAIRSLVLWSPHAPPGIWTQGPHLSDDGLHPNARGNSHLARCVADAIRRVFRPSPLSLRTTSFTVRPSLP